MNDIIISTAAFAVAAFTLWLATREKVKVKSQWRKPLGPLLRLAVVFLGFHLLFSTFGISTLEGYLIVAICVGVSLVGFWLDPFILLLIGTAYVFFEWVFWFPDRDSYILSHAVKGEKTKKDTKLKTGIALSDLKPIGQVEIAGEKMEARSAFGYISKGDSIEIENDSGFELLVRKHEGSS